MRARKGASDLFVSPIARSHGYVRIFHLPNALVVSGRLGDWDAYYLEDWDAREGRATYTSHAHSSKTATYYLASLLGKQSVSEDSQLVYGS